MAESMERTLIAALSEYVARSAAEPLSPSVRRATKVALLHNLTVGLAATGMPLPGVQPDRALPWAASPTTPTDLAFATSLRMGARAQHDEHPPSVSHLGSAVTPACLAIAPRNVDGGRLLAAIATGYQIGGVLGTELLSGMRSRGLRSTGIVGPIAAASAVAVVLGFDEASSANAIALATNRAAGLTEVWLAGTDEWRLQTAAAARDGLESALWAEAGTRGALTVLEGRSGLLNALGAAPITARSLARALRGEPVIEQVLLKAHPVCAINQAAVEVAIRLREGEPGLQDDDIQWVVVRLADEDAAYPGIALEHAPTSWPQAMMDARQGVAVALAEGRVDVNALHPGSAAVQRLRGRIEVVGGMPTTGGHGAEVTIELRNGRRLRDATSKVDVDPDRQAQLASELLPRAGIVPDVAERLPALVDGLDEPGGVARLIDALGDVPPWGTLCSA